MSTAARVATAAALMLFTCPELVSLNCNGATMIGDKENTADATAQKIAQGHGFNFRLRPDPTVGDANVPALNNRTIQQPVSVDDQKVLNTLTDLQGMGDKKQAINTLRNFTAANPDSKWKPAIEAALAARLYEAGYFDDAEAMWRKQWNTFKSRTDEFGWTQAQVALNRLLEVYACWERKDDILALLKEVGDRPREAATQSRIDHAREIVWAMGMSLAQNVYCGPVAVYAIKDYLHQSHTPVDLDFVAESAWTNGISASEVLQTFKEVGLKYQLVRRPAGGGSIPTPCVIHYRIGHYATLLEERDGYYLLDDRPLGYQRWVPIEAIEQFSSGVFFIPAGSTPKGWKALSKKEANGVFGRHCVHNRQPPAQGLPNGRPEMGGGGGGGGGDIPPAGPNDPPPNSCGMPVYSFSALEISLAIRDTPVGYSPPVGSGVYFTVTYKQRDTTQALPANRPYGHFGSVWSYDYCSYIEGDGSWSLDTPANGNLLNCAMPNGGTESYTYDSTLGRFKEDLISHNYFRRTGSNLFERVAPDGSKLIYGVPNVVPGTTRLYLSAIQDSAGNQLTLEYDGNLRLTGIRDAINQLTQIFYENTNTYLITRVRDPFGREAHFGYDAQGRLNQITDTIGLTSTFAYNASDLITNMTTPYGSTTFSNSDGGGLGNFNRTLWATDPLGQTEQITFENPFTSDYVIPPVDPHPPAESIKVGNATVSFNAPNARLHFRNTFFWGKKAYAEAQLDPANARSKAHLTHWLVTGTSYTVIGIKACETPALENRIWYNYAGQGTGEEAAFFTGTNSQPSKVARVMDDGSTQLWQYDWSSQGKLLRSVDPVGRSTTYIYDTNLVDLLEVHQTTGGMDDLLAKVAYDSQHRPLTITDAAGQTTTNTYNARGQLLTSRNPKGEITTLNYHTNGYLLSIDRPLPGTNDSTSFTYDGFGRVRTVTGSDAYVLTYGYDNMNRLTNVTYPDATFEAFTYDKLDRVKSRDRMGRETQYTYDAARRLTSALDPLQRLTRYEYCGCGALSALIDPMGRKTKWEYDVGSRVTAKEYVDGSRVTYKYENATRRLKSVCDEKGQFKVYDYSIDGNRSRISYPNAQIATPAVTFVYDSNYNRMVSMQDGMGTTTYSYNPLTPTLGAGRLASISGPLPNSTVTYQYDQLGRTVSRAINGVATATTYDSLGRPAVVTNALGSFQYSYVNATARLALENYPNGQTNVYTYYDNLSDRRLKQIMHLLNGGAEISHHQYTYNPAGQITDWTNVFSDPAHPLTLPGHINQTFGYDDADQLVSDLQSTGTPLSSIQTNITYAYDPAGNRLQYQTVSQNVTNTVQYSYNALNQLTTTVPAQTNSATYEWDAENRLTAINQGTNRSEFNYDGLGRRLRIVEKTNGLVQSDNCYLWCGTEICEIRDSSGAVVLRRLFPQGEVLTGLANTNCFYIKDHLRSVRELTDSNGALLSRYDYDPFGKRITLLENIKTSFGYAGHFIHQKSGLYLSLFRPLDGTSGRWLSRDPIGERGGRNLYSYVNANPINLVDALGLIYGIFEDPWYEMHTEFPDGTVPTSNWDALKQAESRAAALVGAINNLQQEISNWAQQISNLDQKISQIEVELGKQHCPAVETALRQLLQKMANERSQLGNGIQTLESSLSTLQKQLDEINAEIIDFGGGA